MWEAILQGVFGLVQFFYNLCGDWGLAIIIITIIFRLLVAPLMHKQAKSSYTMQKIQPKINELQEKYKNDQVRLSQEMQKIYADAHFNPLLRFFKCYEALINISDKLLQISASIR